MPPGKVATLTAGVIGLEGSTGDIPILGIFPLVFSSFFLSMMQSLSFFLPLPSPTQVWLEKNIGVCMMIPREYNNLKQKQMDFKFNHINIHYHCSIRPGERLMLGLRSTQRTQYRDERKSTPMQCWPYLGSHLTCWWVLPTRTGPGTYHVDWCEKPV